MIRVSVMYPSGEGKKFDLDYYARKHMALVKERVGGHLYWNSLGDFQKAMGAHGKEVMADVPNFTNIQPQIQISEIVS